MSKLEPVNRSDGQLMGNRRDSKASLADQALLADIVDAIDRVSAEDDLTLDPQEKARHATELYLKASNEQLPGLEENSSDSDVGIVSREDSRALQPE